MKNLVCAWALLALTACSPPTSSDPVGRWNFDEGYTDIAADLSGNRNDGTVVTHGAGTSNGTELFDGKNDNAVVVAPSNSLRGTADAVTVSAWAYRTAQHNVALVAHGYPTLFFGFHGLQFKWQVALSNGRNAVCYADEKYRAEMHRWYHVAATYDGWVARLYVDGKEICNDWSFGSIRMPEAPFTVGAYLDEEGRIVDEMSGMIHDARIYDRALSAHAIEQLFARGRSPKL